jgi:hypothetical protein
LSTKLGEQPELAEESKKNPVSVAKSELLTLQVNVCIHQHPTTYFIKNLNPRHPTF